METRSSISLKCISLPLLSIEFFDHVLCPAEGRHYVWKADGAGEQDEGVIDLLLGGPGLKRSSGVAMDGTFGPAGGGCRQLDEVGGLLVYRPFFLDGDAPVLNCGDKLGMPVFNPEILTGSDCCHGRSSRFVKSFICL